MFKKVAHSKKNALNFFLKLIVHFPSSFSRSIVNFVSYNFAQNFLAATEQILLRAISAKNDRIAI